MRVSVRNWAVRGLILAGVAGVAAAAWVAATWVSPEKVREQVAASLADQFDGAEVRVGAARMRLLGGIAVTDLALTRRGEAKPFLTVPSAVLHPDKERLNRGRLVIRKVELENPTLHLERAADGTWNVERVGQAGPADRPIPTLVASGATVTVTDHTPGGLPPLTLTGGHLLALNDPLPVLTIQAKGTAGGYGLVSARVQINRVTRQAKVGVELPDFPLGEAAGVLAERFAPELAPHLAGFAAAAAVKADLQYAPDAASPWRYDVRAEVKGGRLSHPDLPWPVADIAAKLHLADGRVKVEGATATVGRARLSIPLLETRTDGAGGGRPSDDPLARVEDRLKAVELSAAGVPLDDALFARVGELGGKAKRLFSPTGSADFSYSFARDAGGWKREIELRPQGIGVKYAKFPYPVVEVCGRVRRASTHRGDGPVEVDVTGKAAGQPVTCQGTITGGPPDPGIDLRITGANVPLDDTLVAALPGRYPDLVRQFRAAGRAGFLAVIRQRNGVNLCENEFRLDIRDATVDYVRFPYKLDKVSGQLLVKVEAVDDRPGEPAPPDRDELVLDGFTARHGGAEVWLHGAKRPIPGTRDRKLVLQLGGTNCRVDDDLRRALGGMKLDSVWDTLAPRGTLAFDAAVEVVDRGPPPRTAAEAPPFDPAADLKLTFNFAGPAVTPTFFPYPLTDLRGLLKYHQGRVGLEYVSGRHGPTRVKLDAGEVRFYPDGAVWANLGRMEVAPLVPDADLLGALPPKLGAAVAGLALRGRADLTVNHLVVLTPPDGPGGPPPPEPLPLGPVAGRGLGPAQGVGGQPQYPVPEYPVPEYPVPEYPVPECRVPSAECRVPNGLDGVRSTEYGLSSAGGMGPGAYSSLLSTQHSASSPPHSVLGTDHTVLGTDHTALGTDHTALGTDHTALGTPHSVLRTRYSAPRTPSPAPLARAQAPQPLPTPARLVPDPVVYWDARIDLAGAAAEAGVGWEQLYGAVWCKGRYDTTHLGPVQATVWLDRAVVAGQPVTGITGKAAVSPQQPDPARPGEFLPPAVEFRDLSGNLFHGTVGGEARVVLADPPQYQLLLTAADVQLDEVARHYKLGSDADLKGVAQGKLLLFNRPDPKTGRWVAAGDGTVDVPTGRMYNLPVLLDLVKVVKLQAPDKTAFEEAHATFRVAGDRVHVDQLDLIGKALCVGGSGEVGTDGEYVRFEFYTVGSQLLARLVNTPVGDLTAFLSRNLFRIRLTREDGRLKYTPEPVPVLTDPARALLDRVRKRTGKGK